MRNGSLLVSLMVSKHGTLSQRFTTTSLVQVVK
ncbi:unnamed protein product [Linum tenue]|uniref:Uncharacterized protein n=1 Tax=Linum tenue TaxID=586396 RepID=A0AAV0NKX8_9ROSI|nr:unnamed protein product [Linum tenue]